MGKHHGVLAQLNKVAYCSINSEATKILTILNTLLTKDVKKL
jgi:hypothetical protein